MWAAGWNSSNSSQDMSSHPALSLCSSRAHVTCPCFSPCSCHIPAHTARPLPQLIHAFLATTISSKTVHGTYPCPWSVPPYDPSHTCIPLVLYAYGPLAPRPILSRPVRRGRAAAGDNQVQHNGLGTVPQANHKIYGPFFFEYNAMY